MTPYYQDDLVTLWHGDCVEVMRELPDSSVDAVVTDPPYELGFMGKGWDASGIAYNPEVWGNALRILKPGGHLLAFGGTRTWHRLAVAVEDAGFEVRDSIAWMYGSGFPKSLDVSKAIDRKRDDREDVLRVTGEIARLRDIAGLSNRNLDDAFGFAGMAGHWTSTKSQPTVPTVEQWSVLRDMLNPDEWLDAEVWRLNGRKGQPGEAWAQREVVGSKPSSLGGSVAAGERNAEFIAKHKTLMVDITAPATPAAQQWQGWGTALKPAFEPIVVARKPLIGTVAENVLAHGTGALNIDGSRVGYASEADKDSAQALADLRAKGRRLGVLGEAGQGQSLAVAKSGDTRDGTEQVTQHSKGRWPANVILDESQAAELDRQSGVTTSGAAGTKGASGFAQGYDGEYDVPYGDTGGASRFFYVPKAGSSERPRAGEIAHPTVKPLELMRYLVKLVTPPGGTVLEPFAGSGTTLEACVVEGFQVIGIELTEDYLPLITQRISKPIEQVLL